MGDSSCPCLPPLADELPAIGEGGGHWLRPHSLLSMSACAAANRLAKLSSVSVFRCRNLCS